MKPYKIRRSKIDNLGLYATKDIKNGAKIIEYKGKVITIREAEKNPKYDIAFYFKCSLKKASYRRWIDLKKKIPLKEVSKSLRKRTSMDKKRKHSPLKKAKDAILIRTDILNKKMMIKKMSDVIEKKIN